jgi:cytochrome c-type biogenesis protein CcmH
MQVSARWQRAFALLTTAILLICGSGGAGAVQPDEILKDPKLETRARQISLELRCLVCQNQSIDDSDAPLARDLRLLVRERLENGDSDSEVLDFIVSRYGEFVLLKPPFGWHTLLLWLTPLIVLAGGVWLARSVINPLKPASGLDEAGVPDAALSPDEEAKLKQILDQG